jgi:hypothetical protein
MVDLNIQPKGDGITLPVTFTGRVVSATIVGKSKPSLILEDEGGNLVFLMDLDRTVVRVLLLACEQWLRGTSSDPLVRMKNPSGEPWAEADETYQVGIHRDSVAITNPPLARLLTAIGNPDFGKDTLEVFNKSVADLGLSAKANEVLGRLEISTLGALTETAADELLEQEGFGMAELTEVRDKLRQLGLALADEEVHDEGA